MTNDKLQDKAFELKNVFLLTHTRVVSGQDCGWWVSRVVQINEGGGEYCDLERQVGLLQGI